MNVAIASSGLGHAQRGIEAWATDVAAALKRRGVSVRLFGGALAGDSTVEGLSFLTRNNLFARAAAHVGRHIGAWRIGISNPYDVEQISFSLALWRRIRRDFDILHVQDPRLAWMLDRAHRLGLSRPRVIFANGTGEQPRALSAFSCVQELSPSALDEAKRFRDAGAPTFLVPNFVNVDVFTPGDRAEARARLGLPPDAFIVIAAAAIRRFHKRIDYLLAEAARFANGYRGEFVLVVAGAREAETDELVAMGKDLLGDRVRFAVDTPRAAMPDYYRAADAFVLTSLFETFGIVLLEAMAAGLPVICNEAPVFRYVAGPAAYHCDMTAEQALASALGVMADPGTRAEYARRARPHTLEHFSEAVVIAQILDMYDQVLGKRK